MLTTLLSKMKGKNMFGNGDKVSWSGDEGTVTDSSATKFVVKFAVGTFTFLQSNGKLDNGSTGVGEAVKLLSKAKSKKLVKLYQYQKIGTTSTGQPFLKKTDGYYNDEHAAKILIPDGYEKIESSEVIIDV